MGKTKKEIMQETEELLVDDAAIIDLYEQVLKGQKKSFPRFTWELPNSLYYAKVLTKYLFEKKLGWNEHDIKKNYSISIIRKYRLLGMTKALFKESQFDLIENAYPKKFKPWEFERTSRGFWKNEENQKEALKWLFEVKLKWDINTIKEKVTQETFQKNHLGGLLATYFDDSPYKAINFLYPNLIKPWELQKSTYNFWESDDNKKEALKWLFEVKLEWNKDDIKRNLSRKTFIENDFGGLLTYFHGSPYEAFNFAYPNQIKPWELQQVPTTYWKSDKNKREALNWLFQEKLIWDIDTLKIKTSKEIRETMIRNGFGGLLNKHFQDSSYEVVSFLYPFEEFKLLKVKRKSKPAIQ